MRQSDLAFKTYETMERRGGHGRFLKKVPRVRNHRDFERFSVLATKTLRGLKETGTFTPASRGSRLADLGTDGVPSTAMSRKGCGANGN